MLTALVTRRARVLLSSVALAGVACAAACDTNLGESATTEGGGRLQQGRTGGKGKRVDREQRKAAKQEQRAAERTAREASTAAAMVRVVPLADRGVADERSGAAASRAVPGVFYTMNDSGNEPTIFAFDTTGASRGRWTVRNGRNVDWEALAVGPCGTRVSASAPAGATCLYVGDVGDNAQRRPSVTLYRLREPLPGATRGTLDADVLTVRYPDRAHNTEAMYVASDGAVILIPKANGHLLGMDDVRPALYRVAPTAWGSASPVTATLVDSLPEFAGGGRKRMVTDAALSADGAWLAVRTYEWVAIWPVDATTGLPRRGTSGALCDVQHLDERQGEGVGFVSVAGATARLAFTSEGADQSLRLANCPLSSAPAAAPGAPR